MAIRSIILTLLFAASLSAEAQEVLKLRPSPLAIAAIRYQDHYLKIVYSQPQKKNREIFGNLVPFGKVWRTGANEATEITTIKDVLVNDVILKAGTYSLLSIPEKDKWTIIINTDLGMWGAYNYNSKKDLWRFDVPVQTADKTYEPFTISFAQRNEVADLLMMWDNIMISIPIRFIN